MNATLISKDPCIINNIFFAFCKCLPIVTLNSSAIIFSTNLHRHPRKGSSTALASTAFSTTASSTSFLNSLFHISIPLKSIRHNRILNLFPQQHPPTKHSSQQQPARKHLLQTKSSSKEKHLQQLPTPQHHHKLLAIPPF
jgi:hypothetical protein